tara:strand:+ start:637 stop:1137 length:501 start_codon:yes stop_codon:yes gene_type:complete
MKKYSFNKYSEKYKQFFSKEKSKLKKIFPKAKIEHVGSTSIPGLGGKGIIDIAIKIPKSKLNQFRKKLEGLGYKSTVDHPVSDQSAFFQKIIRYGGKERRIHVHLTFTDIFWDSFIAFREYLRNHDEIRDEYAKIKKEAVRHAKGKAEKYRNYKKRFFRKIMKGLK